MEENAVNMSVNAANFLKDYAKFRGWEASNASQAMNNILDDVSFDPHSFTELIKGYFIGKGLTAKEVDYEVDNLLPVIAPAYFDLSPA